MVLTECNVYHDKTCVLVDHLKGEDWEFIETTTNIPESSMPTKPTRTHPAVSQAILSTGTCTLSPSPSDHQDLHKEELVPQKHVRKPSQYIHDIIEGHGTTSACPSDPAITTEIWLPPIVEAAPNPVLEGEGLADWMMLANFEEYAMVAKISEVEALEPRSLAEAKHHPDWPLWEKAIHEELTLLQETGTWELTDPPTGANIVGSKWVYHAKKDVAGNVVYYKACLIAQEFSLKYLVSTTLTHLLLLQSLYQFKLF
jgi:hypothetical protein